MVPEAPEVIRLVKPDVSEEASRLVTAVLKSGFLVQGRNVARFESLVADYLGVKWAVAVSSGTAALHLALMALEIGEGDEVIVPDFTFPATGNVVALVGAKPVLGDINLRTYNVDWREVEKRITSRTKAIMVVHEFGLSAEMDPIVSIAEANGLFIIEDAACAIGSEYKGRKCGTIGDVGCFSFHPRKIVTTGEGGMLVTDNENIAAKVKALRNHGITVYENKNVFAYAGLNYRMTDFQGVLGITQMQKLHGVIERRRELASLYDSRLTGSDFLGIPFAPEENKHVYQSYVVLLDKKINRDLVISELGERRIEATIGSYALHCQPFYQERYGYREGELENSYKAFRRSLCLPMHMKIGADDIRMVAEGLLGIFNDERA